MKQVTLMLICISCLLNAFSQNDPKPTKSRFFNSNKSTFEVDKSTVLVYSVNNNGDEYDFIVTLKHFDKSIEFSYHMPQKKSAASINIEAGAVEDAVKYNNYFNGTDKTFTNQSTVWLSGKNYRELAMKDGSTSMDMGSGAETFAQKNTSTMKIKYMGEEKVITYYKAIASSGNEVWVLNNIKNPLIVKMSLGWTIELKEVRKQ